MRAFRPITTSGASNLGRFGTRLQGVEQLENRNLLTVSVSSIALSTDTGSSSSDKITSVAALAGSTTGSPPAGGFAQVQFDHNSDGVANGSATVSGGTFSYDPVANDSALATWEGSLTIRYRTRELDSYGGVVATNDWQNFNMTLDRTSPTGNLAPVTVNQDSANTNISLYNTFADGVTSDSLLTYQIISNSNANLFSSVSISGGTLTLDYAPGWSGSAQIVVRATDQAGNIKNSTLNVEVVHVMIAPTITSFSIIHLGSNNYRFEGTVTDDLEMTGYYVLIYVLDPDEFVFAEIQSDGSFSEDYHSTAPGDLALAIACDADGLLSPEEWASFV